MSDRVNDPCPPTTDPMHSMQLVSEAYAMAQQARELLIRANKMVEDDWKWHRPDCEFNRPKDHGDNANAAIESVRLFTADLFWTQNSLRKFSGHIKYGENK